MRICGVKGRNSQPHRCVLSRGHACRSLIVVPVTACRVGQMRHDQEVAVALARYEECPVNMQWLFNRVTST